MNLPAGPRISLLSLFALFFFCAGTIAPRSSAQTPGNDSDLKLVVVLSRHGVRPPLQKQADLDKFSAAPWPQWDVPPGYLTAHGYELMKLFGTWDRAKFADKGLLAPTGCADTPHVTIVADTDQRTRETGKALAEGLFPGCNVAVQSKPDGTGDPLFRPLAVGIGHADTALAAAAIAGRIGGDPQTLSDAYRPQLAALDRVLAGCGRIPANPQRTSIFDIPVVLKPGTGDPPVVSRGPVPTGATLAENLLLEYTQGMSDADTGWGCLDTATLRFIMQMNEAHWEFGFRTPAVARMYSSNLLSHIRSTLEQGVKGKPVPGAVGKPGDRLVILVGHDTNIATLAGALNIDWSIDGRIDDTPPGGALVFELWRSRKRGEFFVRLAYTAQTLDQMRKAQPLTASNPPSETPVFVPACGRADLSCSWNSFSIAVKQAIDPGWVSTAP